MKALLAVLALAAVVAGAKLFASSGPPPVQSNMPNMATGPRHPVDGKMRELSRSLEGRPAADFTLPRFGGQPVRLSSLWKDRPVVLVFTKDRCPCSLEAQPHFSALARAHSATARFVGVMDDSPAAAGKFAEDLSAPYPMLSAPGPAVFAAYAAERSVYVTLVGKGGKIVRQWPGYSKSMLKELDSMLGEPSAGDFEGAPEEATSGCALFKPVGS